MSVNIETYFKKIKFHGNAIADYKTLVQLINLQTQFIPFENIDAFIGITPSLQIEDIFQKLVLQNRGGYCFEQNLLLNHVLKTIGFKTKMILARVLWKKDKNILSAKTHAFIVVKLSGKDYLVDAGFGATTPNIPVKLIADNKMNETNNDYRIVKSGRHFTLEYGNKDGYPMYGFELYESNIKDLDVANWYLSTNPQSGFVKNLMIARRTKSSVYTLQNNLFKHKKADGDIMSRLLTSPEKLMTILSVSFHIDITKQEEVQLLLQKIFHNIN